MSSDPETKDETVFKLEEDGRSSLELASAAKALLEQIKTQPAAMSEFSRIITIFITRAWTCVYQGKFTELVVLLQGVMELFKGMVDPDLLPGMTSDYKVACAELIYLQRYIGIGALVVQREFEKGPSGDDTLLEMTLKLNFFLMTCKDRPQVAQDYREGIAAIKSDLERFIQAKDLSSVSKGIIVLRALRDNAKELGEKGNQIALQLYHETVQTCAIIEALIKAQFAGIKA
jgi:hypothetical protein